MEIKSARGSLLILVLWSFSLLTAFAVSLGFMTRQRATLLNRIEKGQFLWDAAWSGVERGRTALQEDRDPDTDSFLDQWAHDTQAFKGVKIGPARFFVGYEKTVSGKTVLWSGLSDEQGKLNLNTAEPQAVSILLQQVTDMEAADADSVAYAIVDWRDTDSAYGHPDFGAEDADYGGLARPYDAKDSPYESLDELLLVKGMNRAIFTKMKPFVTVFGPGAVNVNTAGREVLIALGLPMAAVDKLVRHRDGLDGLSATGDDRPFLQVGSIVSDMNRDQPPPSDFERTAIANLADSGKITVQSNVFGITSRAEDESGRSELVVEAVISRENNVLYSRSSGFRWRSQ